jgi:hypothetical protein
MVLPEAPKFSTKLVGDCIKQLATDNLIREATEKDKGKKKIICGPKRYVLTDLAERSITALILSMRDQFPDESAADIRSNTLSFLCLAKIGDMLDKKLAVCVTVLDYLSEDNLW